MSLPTIEPLPDETSSLPPARRRRQRRMVVPPGRDERAAFIQELAERTAPTFDFFFFSLLAGLALGIALLLDAPALVFLAALLAPFMAPAVGVSLGSMIGAANFLMQCLASLGIGSLIVFLCGTLAGFAANLLPEHTYQQAFFHSTFTWPDLFLITLGMVLTTYLVVRDPRRRPQVTSAAVAYGLYLPAGVAGFGMSSGIGSLWPDGLVLLIVHLLWAVLTGSLTLGVLGLRPVHATGYLYTALYGLAAVAVLALVSLNGYLTLPGTPQLPQVGEIAGWSRQGRLSPSPGTPTPSPGQPASATPIPLTATITSTRTLVPTRTATLTITPAPTPIWARINAEGSDGALIREEPSYDGKIVQALLNGTLVEVQPQVTTDGGTAWVHVRTMEGKEGWIVRSLLRTATPAPDW